MKKNFEPTIGFIGQGYVGKNYADDFERRGYSVVRYSLENQFKGNKERIGACDIVFVAVPTPTGPQGSDTSAVEDALRTIKEGSVAILKSTVLPGTTKRLQELFPRLLLIFSPEFLSEATAANDTAHPFLNMLGIPIHDDSHEKAAVWVESMLPKAGLTQICDSTEAELMKYAHNVGGYVQIVFFNLMYDLAQKHGVNWETIEKAIQADPFIPNRYAKPVHKSGRGAGGRCFIKDFAAFKASFEKLLPEDAGIDFLRGVEKKNIQLLTQSGKDVNILSSVYGPRLP